jgi:hypothetical protein
MNLVSPFTGGRRFQNVAGAVGIAGLALTALGAAVDVRHALFSYLTAYVTLVGIAVGALILLGTFHASNAKWPVVCRRFIETMAASIPVFLVLFIPIALGMRQLFPWTDPSRLPEELRETVQWRAPYLNTSFFLVRAVFYLALWWVIAHLLRAWSVKQDAAGGVTLTVWQRRLGAGSLPFLAITMSFASFDWMLSLDARFYSTIFAVYWFAGSFMATFAVVIIAATITRSDPQGFGRQMNADHFHALGKFMFAFVAFWAYMAFSQYMLIWIANIPEETAWYLVRTRGSWRWVFVFLVVFKFLVPFFVLLSRDLKRNPRALSLVAGWLLFTQWVDVYWLVMPQLSPQGIRPSWTDLTALAGVGGVAVAYIVWRMRGTAPVPLKDPYLEASLRYLPQ